MITFLTGNEGKLREIQEFLPETRHADVDLPEIQSLDAREVITAKLEEATKQLQGDLIVEDTSLYFEALNGLPGPLIKWFDRAIGNEGLYRIAKAFRDMHARAVTTIGYRSAGGEIQFFEGEITGRIVEPRGTNGFGWDAIFQPLGSEKTFAEMTSEEKNSCSMRKTAAKQLRDYVAAGESIEARAMSAPALASDSPI